MKKEEEGYGSDLKFSSKKGACWFINKGE